VYSKVWCELSFEVICTY